MVKNKFKKVFAGIRWADHLIGLVVVILGITIAFQLDSSREEQIKKNTEQGYLEGLLTDLDYDIKLLDTLSVYGKHQMHSVTSLIALGQESTEPDDSLFYHISNIQYSLPFTPQQVSYTTIKSVGLNTITDPQLRRQITELYEQYYRGVAQYEAALTHHIENFIQPYTIKNIALYAPYKNDTSFLSDPEFKNMMIPLRLLMAAKLDFYNQLHLAITDLNNEIKAKK